MKIIIIGVGKVGETLVANFIKEKHDVLVIDINQERVNYIVNRYDVQGIVGNGLEKGAFNNAEIENADFVIACTSRDEANILSCVLARKLGAKHTIARVRDPEYFRGMENVREELGVDNFFNPELRAAEEIEEILKFPSAKNIENFADGRARMVEFDVLDGNPIAGKSLMEISKDYGNKILFGMVKRGEEIFIPRGDFVLKSGDSVRIIGAESEIIVFTKKLKIYKSRAKSVFIIGGGKIAYYLSQKLLKGGVGVKIVEKDRDRAIELSKELPDATVLLLDATEQEALIEEGFSNSDACVCLTGIDEQNIILSLFAKEKNIGKVITKITRNNLFNMAKTLGLDTVVSPKDAIANHIIRSVRAKQTIAQSGINNLYKIHEKVEALEFTVGEDFDKTDQPIKNLKINKNALLGGIVRKEQFILPSGETVLKRGDRVIIVTSLNNLTALSQIIG